MALILIIIIKMYLLTNFYIATSTFSLPCSEYTNAHACVIKFRVFDCQLIMNYVNYLDDQFIYMISVCIVISGRH